MLARSTACLALLLLNALAGTLLATSALAAYPDAAPRGRLPPQVRPLHYQLELGIDPRQERFGGRVTIRLQLDEALSHLWLHGAGVQVARAEIIAGPSRRAAQWHDVLASGVARIDIEGAPVGPGEVTLILDYDAPFDRNLAGLFAVEEQGEYYALAKSESIQARKYLPGFDEPGFKAPFDISLTIPAGYAAISNGPEVSREAAREGMERVTFATTRPLSTYLLSLAVGPFDVVERPPIPANEVRKTPLPLRGIARKGRGDALAYVLDITPRFVEIFEASLRQPYPYAKLDIVAAPQWPSGATELAAAISYREQRILVDGTPPPAVRRALISVHAHEIAHMWFGNVVTPPWWDDLWLKEGFATWATPFVLTQWEPEAGHDMTARARTLGAMEKDSLASVRRVREPIALNEDIRNAYTSIPYSKGAALIAMADAYFGAEAFRPALGRYVARYADGTADSVDFFEAIGEASGEPALTESFRSFVEQPGVPAVSVQLQCAEDAPPRVVLGQQRYLPLGSPASDEAVTQRWVIPVCVAFAGAQAGATGRACTLLREAHRELELPAPAGHCPAWVHPNADGAGYYRYSLAAEGWQALLTALPSLRPTEALTVIDSAMAAFEAGDLPASTLLRVVEAAAAAEHRLVVTAPMPRLRRYASTVLDEASGRALLRWAGERYRPRLAALAWARTEEDQLLRTELARFLALDARDPAVRRQLARDAAAFVGLGQAPDADALDADRFDTALTVGVQELGAPFVERMLARRDALDDPRFEAVAVKVLGRSDLPALRAEAKAKALAGEFGTRENWDLVNALFEQPATRGEVWDWYRANFTQLMAVIPAQYRRRSPGPAATFCSAGRAQELAALFADKGGEVPGHQRPLRQAMEQIELCAALAASQGARLAGALRYAEASAR
ncbi:MAG: M1 family aminopeptidase [Pseudomonadota bacterium]